MFSDSDGEFMDSMGHTELRNMPRVLVVGCSKGPQAHKSRLNLGAARIMDIMSVAELTFQYTKLRLKRFAL